MTCAEVSAHDYGPSLFFLILLDAFLTDCLAWGFERSLCLFFLEISLSRVFVVFSFYYAYIHIPSRCFFLMLIHNRS
jgi:hypothetical protein